MARIYQPDPNHHCQLPPPVIASWRTIKTNLIQILSYNEDDMAGIYAAIHERHNNLIQIYHPMSDHELFILWIENDDYLIFYRGNPPPGWNWEEIENGVL
jgi:hypothetical protein